MKPFDRKTAAEVVGALYKYSACDVSDALAKLGHPHGGLLPDIVMFSPAFRDDGTTICGPAYTLKYVWKDDPDTARPAQKEHEADTIPKGSVVFVQAPEGTIDAVFGGLMATRAQYSGAVGTVVDGRVRDLQEYRKLGYPVFARSTGTAPGSGSVRVAGINVPLTINAALPTATKSAYISDPVTVNPSDYIIADCNGVVVLPKELAEKALELIPSQVEADELAAEDILSGIPFDVARTERRKNVKWP